MIVSELTGGLGNQLFQYATGFAAAQRGQQTYRLDLRHFDHVVPGLPSRPYALHRFSISTPVLSLVERLWVTFTLLSLEPRRRGRLLSQIPFPRLEIVRDAAMGYDPRLQEICKSCYLVGCWQTAKFFSEYRDTLIEEFTFKEPPSEANGALIERMRASGNAISVHFRRTDYLHQDTLTRPCSLAYYAKAFETMTARFPEATYFIFTDDPDWVRANAPLPPGSTLVSHNTGVNDAEDLRLMTHCDHFVIANSSFSWWGAWLSKNESKVVIAPAVWYEQAHGSEGDLVPKTWLRM